MVFSGRRGALLGLVLGTAAAWGAASPALAEVERIEILERSPLAGGKNFGAVGAYEKIVGRLHYAVDPKDAANAPITDIALAPRDGQGKVTFSGDFVLLRPKDGGKANGSLLYEVDNRGNAWLFNLFDDAPLQNDLAQTNATGDGWLLDRGYSILWSGWNWDVVPGKDRHQIDLPIATQPDGKPITGKVGYEIIVNAPAKSASYLGILAKGYPFAEGAKETAELTVRDAPNGPRTIIPRTDWRFARAEDGKIVEDPSSVYVEAGLEPGRLYELTYTAQDPRVIGLGLAAIRDSLSFFRFEAADAKGTANPLLADGGSLPKRNLAFGISQSGRAIQTLLLDGLHVDEKHRPVLDGAFIHVAGGGKGGFNIRFGQTTRHFSPYEERLYATDFFPFTTVPETDPVTGEKGSVLAKAHALGAVPKLIYTASSTDYWARSASLLTTDTEGRRDLGLDPSARNYLLAGGQHVVMTMPNRGFLENCVNPLDYRPQLKALLVALDRWVADGTEPPESFYPRLLSGGLVDIKDYRAALPSLPGVRVPSAYFKPDRLDFGPDFARTGIATVWPPIFGKPYGTLVARPDKDGNDLDGVRAAEIAVPVGSYLPWNLRNAQAGASDQLARLFGSFVPFAVTKAERLASGDPRLSLEERYGDRDAYTDKVRQAARHLVAQGFLLDEDVSKVVTRASALFKRVSDKDKSDRSCGYLTGS